MTQTKTAIEAEVEAARNWCAGLLLDMKSQFEDATSKRYIDRVVEMLGRDTPTPLTDGEKRILCGSWYTELDGLVCTVRGVEYTECGDCPYFTGEDIV